MHVLVEGSHNDRGVHDIVKVNADGDYTGKVRVTGLKAGREYGYKVWFSTATAGRRGVDAAAEGHFRTPPASKLAEALVFGWGGDLAGQNVCRDAVEGFPIFKAMNAAEMDFFIGLGDMIYADGLCNPIGLYGNVQVSGPFLQAANLADYWGHWRYNRADDGYRSLLASMPYYAIWDDHEVVNDFGPLHDIRATPPYTHGVHLMPMGPKAMLDYNPILPAGNTPERLYQERTGRTWLRERLPQGGRNEP